MVSDLEKMLAMIGWSTTRGTQVNRGTQHANGKSSSSKITDEDSAVFMCCKEH